ncbi:MAG: class I SAM-dependent methyltransferase [Holophaga sp.]|jgi:SAM-dependent methyltransferase
MRSWPPVFRAFLALATAFGLLALALEAGAPLRALPGAWVLVLVGLAAAVLGRALGLPLKWAPFLLAFPWAAALLLRHPLPGWVWPAALGALVLVYGGGVLTRVPLYLSDRAAWEALLALLPAGPTRFADLGAGLGGPLAFLARARPDARFRGVEASPLTWLAAWVRTLPRRSNCRVRWGSLWREDLGGYDVVFAFLSPAPMPALWAKARREMKPGSLLVSHTFEIPGQEPERRIPLPGRPDACLLVWRI